jgi:hypothetical protein
MKIEKENLTDEIQILLKDFFEAIISKNENNITMQFMNGQKFPVSIEAI